MTNLKFLLANGLVAALYAALTLALAPISYGPVQIRISEFMTLLAFWDRKYIPGLVLGCFLANIGSPFGVTDMLVGTFATFLAVYGMKYCPNLFTASLLPALTNGVIIGLELYYLAALPPSVPLWMFMVYIALGEFLSVSVLGILIVKLLLRNEKVQLCLKNNRP